MTSAVDISSDYFTLFSLPPRFALDLAALEDAYRRIQGQVHPDRFAAAGAAEQRAALQWATRANEAVRALRSPIHRAAYLCAINGHPVDAGSRTAMAPEFLTQQMQWREALDEEPTAAALTMLAGDVDRERARLLAELEAAIDRRQDFDAAADLTRRLMFIERFAADVDAAAERSGLGVN